MAEVRDRRTVFVQGISFELQDHQFEEAFSEIGPVRKCFLIRKKGEDRHKGSGFVQFALPDDAERAAKEFDGKLLLGRRVQVTCANKRAPLAERKERKRNEREALANDPAEEPIPKKAKCAKVTALESKSAFPRTVALGVLQPAMVDEALSLARAAGEVIAVVKDAPEADIESAKLRQDGCSGAAIFVTYKTVKMAVEAVSKLHGARLRNTGVTQKESKRKEPSESPENEGRLWARQLKGEGAMVKKWRVIIRNLPFKVTEEDLRQLLKPAGFVWQITLPNKEDGTLKGFAFASFTSRAHAERAIKVANGKSVRGRPIAVDWAVSKAAFQAGQPDEATAVSATAVATGNAEAIADAEGSDSREEAGEGEAEEEKDMLRRLAQQLADGGAGKEKSVAKPKAVPQAARIDQEKVDPQQEKEGSTLAASPASQAARGAQQAKPGNQGINRTVFVRGLLSDSTKQELQARLESFGSIKACRLVINPTTKQPKGTAFVEFEESTAAVKAANASHRGRSGEGPGVSLAGRLLDIDVALTQHDARAMAAQKSGPSRPNDKRNLYLAKEGAVEEGSPAWASMSKGDQQRRKRASMEKATKLRSPNFFVSPTRLSLRNLPFSLDEKALKSLLIAAVKERAVKEVPKLKQVKVLRDPSKKDKDGQPTSKGFAFAEFAEHEHAMCALRQLNNNPAPFGKERRPIVEFAVENAQTVKKREIRESARKGSLPVQGKKRGDVEGQPRRPKLAEGPAPEVCPLERQPAPQPQRKCGGRKNPAAEDAPKAKRIRPEAPQGGFPSKEATALGPAKAGKPPAESKSRKSKDSGSLKADGPEAWRNKQQHSAETADKLDNMIAKYKASLFGSERSGVSREKAALKRWYE